MPPRFFVSFHADRKYILMFAIALLLIVAAVTVTTVWVERRAEAEQELVFNRQQLLQTRLAAQALSDYFNHIFSDVGILSRFAVREFEQGDRTPKALKTNFEIEEASHPEYIGHFYFTAPNLSGLQVDSVSPHALEDPQNYRELAIRWSADHWTELGHAGPGGLPTVPSFMIDQGHQWMSVLQPVYSGVEFRGVLVVILDLAPVTRRYVEPMHSGRYGSGFLIDGLGRILYDHETMIIGHSILDGMHNGFPDVQRFDQVILTQPEGMDSYHFTIYRGGAVERKLAAWNTVAVGQQKLIVALAAPSIEINSALDTVILQRDLLTAIVIAVVIFYTATFFRSRQRMLQQLTGSLQSQVKERTTELVASQEALRTSSETLRALFDYSPLAITLVDTENYTLMWNRAAKHLFGWDEMEVLGKQLPFIIPDRQQEYESFSREVLSGHNLVNYETVVRRRDGALVNIQVSSAALHDRNGQVDARMSILNDISDRKRIEEENRIDEMRLSGLVRISQQAMVSLSSLLSLALEEVMALSASQFGYIYFYNEDQRQFTLHAWSKSVQEACPLPAGKPYIPLEETGLWGDPVRQRKAVVINDYSAHTPAHSGLPEGHVPVKNFMTLPVFNDNRIVAVVGVANKPGDYTDLDVRELDLMIDSVWKIASRRHAEEMLRENNARLATLDQISQKLAGIQLDFNATLQSVAVSLAEWSGDMSFIGLLSPDHSSYTSSAFHAANPQIHAFARRLLDETPFIPDKRLVQAVTENGQAFLLLDPARELLKDADLSPMERFYERFALNCAIIAPLHAQGKLIGLLILGRPRDDRPTYTDEDKAMVQELANRAALAITNARLYEDNQRRLEHLQALYSNVTAITSSLDLPSTLNIIVNQVTGQLKADAANILLLNPHSQRLEFVAGCGFKHAPLTGGVRIGEGPAGRAAREERMVYLPNLQAEPEASQFSPNITLEGFTSYFGLPLIARGQLKGVLEVFTRAALHPDREWMNTLQTLAGQASIAVDHAALFADLAQAYDETIEGWSRVLDMRDNETEGHSRRVKDLTERLAQSMGVSDSELIHIRRGAWLHDIGKMAIPDEILHKRGGLDEAEWAIMRRHPLMALEMLYPIQYLRPALDIPVSHHEKWDGTGYPRALKGEKIPLAARIFAVVDVYDALTSNRPYRPAWTPATALAYIRAESGQHFDPTVVEAFLKMVGA